VFVFLIDPPNGKDQWTLVPIPGQTRAFAYVHLRPLAPSLCGHIGQLIMTTRILTANGFALTVEGDQDETPVSKVVVYSLDHAACNTFCTGRTYIDIRTNYSSS
jgi:hypothetical protein